MLAAFNLANGSAPRYAPTPATTPEFNRPTRGQLESDNSAMPLRTRYHNFAMLLCTRHESPAVFLCTRYRYVRTRKMRGAHVGYEPMRSWLYAVCGAEATCGVLTSHAEF
eukprot:1775620-Rhodomonas_salina.1